MQKVFIIGNIGQSAYTINEGPERSAWAFTVAVNESYTKRTGEKVEETQWYNCVYNIRNGSKLPDYLVSGAKVFVEGKPSVNTFTRRNGEFAASFSVLVNDLKLVGSKSDPQQAQQPQQPQGAPAANNAQGSALQTYQQTVGAMPQQQPNPHGAPPPQKPPQSQLGQDNFETEDDLPF